ncbi:hypothetical protein E2C01_018641 [Portunus trituberculatus]|uniref:Uncharacterized protein n=1 Tax=Portunus trituberculatus TaxID=210409 RepID=A0A5B7DX35_PORTR|nr:hypothetical protein [Portunus trituberculatus]
MKGGGTEVGRRREGGHTQHRRPKESQRATDGWRNVTDNGETTLRYRSNRSFIGEVYFYVHWRRGVDGEGSKRDD